MTAKNYFDIAKDVVTAIAAGTAAVVAVLGLKVWKKQLKGNAEYDLARRLLKSTLKLRDAIKQVRNPWIPIAETANAMKEMGFDTKMDNSASIAVYQVRWKKIMEVVSDLQIETLEAEVLWGKEIVEIQKKLGKCVVKLNIAINQFFNPDVYGKPSQSERIDNIIYDMGNDDEPDKFSKEINEAISEIESYLKIYLKF